MTPADEIRTAIARYISDGIDLDELEGLVARAASAVGAEDRLVASLSSDVIGAVANLDAGAIDEDELRREIAPLVADWAVTDWRPRSGSVSIVERLTFWAPTAWAVAGKPHGVASG